MGAFLLILAGIAIVIWGFYIVLKELTASNGGADSTEEIS